MHPLDIRTREEALARLRSASNQFDAVAKEARDDGLAAIAQLARLYVDACWARHAAGGDFLNEGPLADEDQARKMRESYDRAVDVRTRPAPAQPPVRA